MSVTGITRREDAGLARRIVTHIVELVSDAMADVVDRPPDHFLDVKRVGLDDAVGSRDHVFLGELAVRGLFIGTQLVQLNVHPEHVAALSRQYQHVAFIG